MKFGNIELTPKRIVALCSYPVDLVNSTNVDVQNAFVCDLLGSIEQAFERALPVSYTHLTLPTKRIV